MIIYLQISRYANLFLGINSRNSKPDSDKLACQNWSVLRSFTLQHPQGAGKGSSIGVVLYQKAFFVKNANEDLVQELMGKDPYPTGGMQVSWDGNPAAAYCWHVFLSFWLEAIQ